MLSVPVIYSLLIIIVLQQGLLTLYGTVDAHPNPADITGSRCNKMWYEPLSKISISQIEGNILSKRNAMIVYHSTVEKNEVQAYAGLRPAYTMSNQGLVEARVAGTPRAALWANDQTAITGLTSSHPRKNRTNCLRVTAQSAQFPVPIYEEFKFPPDLSTVSSSPSPSPAGVYNDYKLQYVYYAQHGFVHDIGSIVLQSGQYQSGIAAPGTVDQEGCVLQSSTGCESATASVAKKWGARCLSELSRLNIQTSDFFALHRPAVRRRLLEAIFVQPFLNFKAQRAGQAQAGSQVTLQQFASSKLMPRLCLLNMTQLMHTLVGAAAAAAADGTAAGTAEEAAVVGVGTPTTISFPSTPSAPGLGLGLELEPELTLSAPSPSLYAPVTHHSVLVMTALWDHNYHHFIVDSLVKIIRYLPFLAKHPHVKIHIRRFEQFCKKLKYVKGGLEIRRRFWDLLGIVLRTSDAGDLSPNGLVSDRLIAKRIVSGDY